MSEFTGEWIDHPMVYHTFRAWRERLGRYRLAGSRCRSCGAIWFPARHGVCGKCNSSDIEEYQCAQEGSIAEYIIKDNPFTDLSGSAPYGRGKRVVAMVKLDDGLYVWSDVVDCPPEGVSVGMRVRMTTRKWMRESNSNWQYGYKFVPA